MTKVEFFDECRLYSDKVLEQNKKTQKYLEENPGLPSKEHRAKYWELRNEVTKTEAAWMRFCHENGDNA